MKRIETRAEMLHQAAETATQLMNRAAQLPEDTSKIVYTFADGWTIRQPQTWQDLDREGKLMSNCLAASYSDPGGYPWGFWWDYHDKGGSMNDLIFDRNGDPIAPIYSLRDPQNLPHATLDVVSIEDAPNLAGRHNSDIKPEYYYRFVDAGFNPDDMYTETELDENPQRTVPQYPNDSQITML